MCLHVLCKKVTSHVPISFDISSSSSSSSSSGKECVAFYEGDSNPSFYAFVELFYQLENVMCNVCGWKYIIVGLKKTGAGAFLLLAKWAF